jgi:hypothetical protein
MKYHRDTPIVVHYEADHEAPTFNDLGSPMLTHGRHPQHGHGWTLWFIEPNGNGVEEYFIGGDLVDVEWAVESARRHLEIVGQEE